MIENYHLVRAATNTCPIKQKKEKERKKQFPNKIKTYHNKIQVKCSLVQDNALMLIFKRNTFIWFSRA